MRKIIAGVVALAALAPFAAVAGPAYPGQGQWMTEDAMKAKVAEMGYQKIKTFKVLIFW